MPAAVATDSGKQLPSQVTRDSHAGPQFVAEGSATVFINGRPAARIGDHTTCGAKISGGSNNVFIGGGTVSTVDIESEVPVWGHLSVAVSGIASCILLRIPIANIASGALLGAIAGSAGRWIGGELAGEGSNTQHLLEGTFGLLGAAYGGAFAEQRAMAFARFKSALAGGEAKNSAEITAKGASKPNQEKLSGPSENWKTYLAKEREVIEKAPLRRNAREFDNKIKSIRNKLPNSKLRNRDNTGMAEVKTQGIKKQFIARSKINNIDDKGYHVEDFSLLKEENDRIFTQYKKISSWEGGKLYDRFVDTEAKILEHIGSLINSDTEGTIMLYTEKPPCQSCSNIINEFRGKFPKIKLTVIHKEIQPCILHIAK